MRLTTITSSPFHTFEHRIAAGGGRTATQRVALYRAGARGLPEGLDALVIASDLQGVAPVEAAGGALRLAGEALAEQLAGLADRGIVPALARTGVVLAGDLYSTPSAHQRGASGDVRSVWRAFAGRCRWVAGVAGNHDTFGTTAAETASFRAEPRIHLLDSETVTLDGLRIGGVGGILGDPSKPGRRAERDFLRAVRRVLMDAPDLLVMHHGPDVPREELRGHPEIRRALDRSGHLLVVCGHVHWPTPVAELRGGSHVLNVDGRVVLLEREAKSAAGPILEGDLATIRAAPVFATVQTIARVVAVREYDGDVLGRRRWAAMLTDPSASIPAFGFDRPPPVEAWIAVQGTIGGFTPEALRDSEFVAKMTAARAWIDEVEIAVEGWRVVKRR